MTAEHRPDRGDGQGGRDQQSAPPIETRVDPSRPPARRATPERVLAADAVAAHARLQDSERDAYRLQRAARLAAREAAESTFCAIVAAEHTADPFLPSEMLALYEQLLTIGGSGASNRWRAAGLPTRQSMKVSVERREAGR